MEDFYNDMDLEDLYRSREAVEERIDNFFGVDDTFYAGDQGYQDLLEDLGNIQDHINELIGYEE
jgi:hypothetical protein